MCEAQSLPWNPSQSAPSELQHHLHHVVLVAVRVGSVAGDRVAGEAEIAQGLDGVGFEVGDEHAGEVTQAVATGDVDELVDQGGAQAGAAPGGVDEPLDAADEAERAAVAAVQGGVGDDLGAVEGEEREDLGVVQLAAPGLDQRLAVDPVPGEAADGVGQVLEEVEESVDVVFAERTNEEATSVAEDDLLGKAFRHMIVLRKRSKKIVRSVTQAPLGGSKRYATPHE